MGNLIANLNQHQSSESIIIVIFFVAAIIYGL